jgi:hypothetical protein
MVIIADERELTRKLIEGSFFQRNPWLVIHLLRLFRVGSTQRVFRIRGGKKPRVLTQREKTSALARRFVVRLLKGATRYASGPAAVAAITLQQTGASSTYPSVG